MSTSDDEGTEADWLVRKIQRDLEEFITGHPGRLLDEVKRLAAVHDLPENAIDDWHSQRL